MGQDILTKLFDDKMLSVLRLFYANDNQDFYMREIAKKTGVPLASTFRIVQKLVDEKILVVKTLKKFKVYQLGDNEHTRFLGQLVKKEKQALQVFVTRAKGIKGLERILLQGREERDRANVIIIGEKIDNQQVKELCGSIRQEFNFTVTALVLAREQFEQMNNMGLYPGKKQVLFKR